MKVEQTLNQEKTQKLKKKLVTIIRVIIAPTIADFKG